MGAPLKVVLPANRAVGDKIRVQIFYSTTKACTALQWLDKECALAMIYSHTQANLTLYIY